MSGHSYHHPGPLRGTTAALSAPYHQPQHPPLSQHPPAPAQRYLNQSNYDYNPADQHDLHHEQPRVPHFDGLQYRSHEQAQYSDQSYSAASLHNPIQVHYNNSQQSAPQPYHPGPSQQANVAWPEPHHFSFSSVHPSYSRNTPSHSSDYRAAPSSEPIPYNNDWVPFTDSYKHNQTQVIAVESIKLVSARTEEVKEDIASLIELISSKRYHYRLLCHDLTSLVDKVENQSQLERMASVFTELLDLARRTILMEQKHAREYKKDCREDFLSALQKLKNYMEVKVISNSINDESDGGEDDHNVHIRANEMRSNEDEALVHERQYSCWLDPENPGILKLRKMKVDDNDSKDPFSWDGDHIITVPDIKGSFDVEFRLLSKFKEILAKGRVNTLPVPSSSKLSEYQRSIQHEFKLNIIMKPFMRPHSTFVSCMCRFYDYAAFNDDGQWKEVQNKLLLTLPVLPEKIPLCESKLPPKEPPLYLAKNADIILTRKEKAASFSRNGQMHRLRNIKPKSRKQFLELKDLENAERIAIGKFNYLREMKQLQSSIK